MFRHVHSPVAKMHIYQAQDSLSLEDKHRIGSINRHNLHVML